MNPTSKQVSQAWAPVRWVRAAQTCAFCQNRIPKGKPGSVKGERGTKAWWNRITGEWECLPCRTEGFRAEAAREELTRRAQAASFRAGESS